MYLIFIFTQAVSEIPMTINNDIHNDLIAFGVHIFEEYGKKIYSKNPGYDIDKLTYLMSTKVAEKWFKNLAL